MLRGTLEIDSRFSGYGLKPGQDTAVNSPECDALQQLRTGASQLCASSPEDESWEKLPFYAAHNVDEVLILKPDSRAVHWLALTNTGYVPVARSGLVDLGPGQLARHLGWD